MSKRIAYITVPVCAAVLAAGTWLARAGDLDPPPGPIGPTMKSLSKVDHAGTFTHLFNQKFTPSEVAKNNGATFIAMLRTFVDLGIHHTQFNVISRGTLCDAQAHPENYSDLVVRTAGLAAYFVDMTKAVQDQIIARTELDLG